MIRKKIPKETYKVFQGSEWPSYENYCRGKKLNLPNIKKEIIDLEKKIFIESLSFCKIKEKLLKSLQYHRVILHALIPGIFGLIIFLAISNEYWVMIPICAFFYVLNYFYNIGVHRWLSHRQFEPKLWFKYFLLYCSIAVGGFKPHEWVNSHTMHHRHTDTDDDPYSPNRGFWRLFFCYNGKIKNNIRLPKVFEDPAVNFVSKHHTHLHTLNLLFFLAIDVNLFLLSFLFLKCYTYVSGGFSNYMLHIKDNIITPTNLPWYLEFIFGGECLHKNHHDKPWQFNYGDHHGVDYSYQLIKKYFSKSN